MMGFADSSKGNFRKGENRDTLHSFSTEYVKALAEVFGWKVGTSQRAGACQNKAVLKNRGGRFGCDGGAQAVQAMRC
jgi:hypothetical protein